MSSDDDDDFEGGDNQLKKRDEFDIEDEDKFKREMGTDSDNDLSTRDDMTL